MTAEELRELWTERDRRYAKGKRILSDAEVGSVRAWRMRETDEVDERYEPGDAAIRTVAALTIDAGYWVQPPLVWVR